jgi:hypothetical protein
MTRWDLPTFGWVEIEDTDKVTIRHEWDVNIPVEGTEWQIGLIVGPSGSGKTTIGRRLFPDGLGQPFRRQASAYRRRLSRLAPGLRAGGLLDNRLGRLGRIGGGGSDAGQGFCPRRAWSSRTRTSRSARRRGNFRQSGQSFLARPLA